MWLTLARSWGSGGGALSPHDHGFDIGFSVGSLGLRLALLCIVTVVAAYALLKPFLAGQLDENPRWFTVTTGSGVLVALLLSSGPTVSRQLLVMLLAAGAVPIYVTYRRAYDMPAMVCRAAPVVLTMAGAGAAVLFARGVLAGAGPATFYDGLMLALVGLSWLVLCRHRARTAGVLSAAGGWLLASATVAGAGHVAMLTLAEG